MARYHQIGRFSENQTPNLTSSLYHLTKSANCGIVDSLYTLAHIHLEQPHEDFEELSVDVSGCMCTCVCKYLCVLLCVLLCVCMCTYTLNVCIICTCLCYICTSTFEYLYVHVYMYVRFMHLHVHEDL